MRVAALSLGLFFAGAVWAAESASQTVDLKLVDANSPYSLRGESLKDGRGEIAFPNKRGKLAFVYKDKRLTLDSNGDGKVDGRDRSIKPDDSKPEVVRAAGRLGGRDLELPLFIRSVSDQGDGQQMLVVMPPEEQLSSAIQVIFDLQR